MMKTVVLAAAGLSLSAATKTSTPVNLVTAPATAATREVHMRDTDVVRLQCRPRHNTILVFKDGGQVAVASGGDVDKGRWSIDSPSTTRRTNVLNVKPSRFGPGSESDLNVITTENHTYSFILESCEKCAPDVKVFVYYKEEKPAVVAVDPHLAEIERLSVGLSEAQLAEKKASEYAKQVEVDSAAKIDREITEFRHSYPLSLRHDYAYKHRNQEPFKVQSIEADSDRTYITIAGELTSIYTWVDGKPALTQFSYNRSADGHGGTYVVEGALKSGYLQLGRKNKLPFRKDQPVSIKEKLREMFGPRDSRLNEVEPNTASGQPPIHIHMPGTAQRRKLPGGVVAVGILLVLVCLMWAGRKTAKPVESPAASVPVPTSTDRIRGWNNKDPMSNGASDAGTAERLYDANMAELKRKGDQAAAEQRARELYGVPGGSTAGGTTTQQLTPAQQAAADRQKRDEESLMASSVIHIPEPEVAPQLQPVSVNGGQRPQLSAPDVAEVATDKTSKDCLDVTDSGVKKFALCEGTTLPAILVNRLEGEFAGPVKGLIARDQFARDGQHLLIPAGTVVLGEARKVDAANQKRMEVSFHRLILANGRGLQLEKMIALDQAGETALSGKLNRHLLSTFGTAALMGGLGAFAQAGAGSAYTGSGIDAYRAGVAGQMGQQGQQVLQRGMNRPNEIRVPEGKIIAIWLSSDIHLPEITKEELAKLQGGHDEKLRSR